MNTEAARYEPEPEDIENPASVEDALTRTMAKSTLELTATDIASLVEANLVGELASRLTDAIDSAVAERQRADEERTKYLKAKTELDATRREVVDMLAVASHAVHAHDAMAKTLTDAQARCTELLNAFRAAKLFESQPQFVCDEYAERLACLAAAIRRSEERSPAPATFDDVVAAVGAVSMARSALEAAAPEDRERLSKTLREQRENLAVIAIRFAEGL